MVTCYVPDATCDEEGEFYSNVELPPCLRSRLFLSNAVLWPVAQSNEVEGSEESLDFDLAASSVGLARIGETFGTEGLARTGAYVTDARADDTMTTYSSRGPTRTTRNECEEWRGDPGRKTGRPFQR